MNRVRRKKPAGTVSAPIPAQQERALGWEQVREVARRHLDRFISLEPKVLRGDDPDAVHDLRVASRRLQQVLDLLYPLPQPRKIRKLRRTIRRSRQVLSEVRNCDVLLDRVATRLGRKRIGHLEIWKAFQSYLQKRRSESLRLGLRKWSKLNLAAFYVRLLNCLDSLPETPARPEASSPDGPVAEAGLKPEAFQERIAGTLQETWQAFQTRIQNSHQDPGAGSLHAVRIAGKRLRYLIETIGEFGVSGSDQALVWFRRLQKCLGNWHDLEVQEQMLIEMVARQGFLEDHMELAIRIERLALRNRRAKKHHEEKYFQMTADSGEWLELQGWIKNHFSPAHESTRSIA